MFGPTCPTPAPPHTNNRSKGTNPQTSEGRLPEETEGDEDDVGALEDGPGADEGDTALGGEEDDLGDDLDFEDGFDDLEDDERNGDGLDDDDLDDADLDDDFEELTAGEQWV